MNIHEDTEVRSIVVDDPAMSHVFEQFGIDYYCDRGRKSLAAACEDLQLSLEQVLDRLNEQKSLTTSGGKSKFPFDPHAAPLARIVEHIVIRYHANARRDIPRLRALTETVRRRYATPHPELIEVEKVFRMLSEDFEHYMHKEEQALFPGFAGQKHALQARPGLVRNLARPIHVMKEEHQDCKDMLQLLRSLTDDFVPPQDACPTYITLYRSLEQFESDSREHLYLEDDVLFPRALKEGQS